MTALAKLDTVTALVYNSEPDFNAVLSDNDITFAQEAGFATQVLASNDFLLGVALKNPRSVINAVTNIAAIGISLNPAKKHAYLVPRKGAVCLDISYMGLMHLAIQSGSIKWAQAVLVREGDRFTMMGVDKPPLHERNPFAPDRGNIIGVYVVAKTADGDYLTEAMSREEIDEIMNRSESVRAGRSSPWTTDYGEMAKKTVVKRAQKYWPKTDRLEKAVHYMDTEGGEGIVLENEYRAMTEDRVEEIIKTIQEAQDEEALVRIWKESVAEIKRDGGSVVQYERVKQAVVDRHGSLKNQDAEDAEFTESENYDE